MTHLVELLGFGGGAKTCDKLRLLLAQFGIDTGHFKSRASPKLDRAELAVRKRASEQRLRRKYSAMRAALQQQERWILEDSRRDDKRRSRENDLTLDIIRLLIAGGCVYCGETQLRMTLDRKDNALGHVVDNVVPACIRCNYSRRDMPYSAWLVVADSMRKAREQGLFGSWSGTRPHSQ